MTLLIINRWPIQEVPYHNWIGDTPAVLMTTTQSIEGVAKGVLQGYTAVVTLPGLPDGTWEVHAQGLAKLYNVTSVLALAERDILWVARVRQALTIGGQHTRSAKAYRDKLHMKRHLERAAIPVVQYARVDHPSQALSFLEKCGSAMVLKPRRGAGSIGVFVIKDEQSLRDTIQSRQLFVGDAPANLMAEQYQEHELYQVNGLIHNGRALVAWPAWTSDCMLETIGDALVSHTLAPSDPLREPLSQLALSAIRALPSPALMTFHAELFRASDGRLIVNEIASRVGGAKVREEYTAAFGVDLIETFVRLSVGQGYNGPYELAPGRQAGYAQMIPGHGRVSKLPSGSLPAPNTVYEVLVREGDILGGPESSNHAVASFVVDADDVNTVISRLRQSIAWFNNGLRLEPE